MCGLPYNKCKDGGNDGRYPKFGDLIKGLLDSELSIMEHIFHIKL